MTYLIYYVVVTCNILNHFSYTDFLFESVKNKELNSNNNSIRNVHWYIYITYFTSLWYPRVLRIAGIIFSCSLKTTMFHTRYVFCIKSLWLWVFFKYVQCRYILQVSISWISFYLFSIYSNYISAKYIQTNRLRMSVDLTYMEIEERKCFFFFKSPVLRFEAI